MKKNAEEKGKIFKYNPSLHISLVQRNPNGDGFSNRFPLEYQRFPPGRCRIRWGRSNGYLVCTPDQRSGQSFRKPSLNIFSGSFKVHGLTCLKIKADFNCIIF